jgi:hypothetical protein
MARLLANPNSKMIQISCHMYQYWSELNSKHDSMIYCIIILLQTIYVYGRIVNKTTELMKTQRTRRERSFLQSSINKICSVY